MNRSAFLIFTALILCCAGCGKREKFPPADRSYMMKILRKQCEILPRHSGTEGAGKTAELIRNEINQISAAADGKIRCGIRTFTDMTPSGEMTFRNVVAVFPGKSKKNPVVIGAHYDAKKLELTPRFQAANDGASGVSVLLAVMKNLAEQKAALPFPVHFIFFDGEECQHSYSSNDGLHGSKRAVREFMEKESLSAIGKPRAMILADMVGDQDWNIVLPANSSENLASVVLRAAGNLGLEQSVTRGKMNVLDDHVPFLDAGIPSVDLIDFEYGPDNIYWHTAEDTVDKISPESLGKTADLILQILTLIK